MKNKKILGWAGISIGLLISALTHFYMIYQFVNGQSMANMMMLGHAILNIIGLILIITGLVLKR